MVKIIFLFLVILILSGCAFKPGLVQPAPSGDGDINPAGQTILMVVAPKDFRDSEYLEPRQVFDQQGIPVKVASIQPGQASGTDGASVEIDLTVSEVNPQDFAAVVFIGGPGLKQIIDDESLQVLAQKFYSAGKLTAAICAAPAILAKAGILQGRQASSCAGIKEELAGQGAIISGQAVSQDGSIITAGGPDSAKQFGQKIVEALK